MKTIRNIPDAFPYFYFILIFSLPLLNQFVPVMGGTPISILIIISIIFIFLLAYIFRHKVVTRILGVCTFLYSLWMLAALLSDFINHSDWTTENIRYFYFTYAVLNFAASARFFYGKEPQRKKIIAL